MLLLAVLLMVLLMLAHWTLLAVGGSLHWLLLGLWRPLLLYSFGNLAFPAKTQLVSLLFQHRRRPDCSFSGQVMGVF